MQLYLKMQSSNFISKVRYLVAVWNLKHAARLPMLFNERKGTDQKKPKQQGFYLQPCLCYNS